MKRICVVTLVILAILTHFFTNLGIIVDIELGEWGPRFLNDFNRITRELSLIISLIISVLVGVSIITRLSPIYLVIVMMFSALIDNLARYTTLMNSFITIILLAIILVGILKKSKKIIIIASVVYILYSCVYAMSFEYVDYDSVAFIVYRYLMIYALTFRSKKLLYISIGLVFCLDAHDVFQIFFTSLGDIYFIEITELLSIMMHLTYLYGFIRICSNENK